MKEKREKNIRNRYMQIRLTEEEYNAIEHKFKNSGMRSRSDFIRAMIFEGYLVKFNENELKAIRRLVSIISANVNQIAIRVNTTGNLYAADTAEIKDGINQIWQSLNYFQTKLLKLKK